MDKVEVDDPNLPPIYKGYDFVRVKEGLKTAGEWKKDDRCPRSDASPRAVIWWCNRWEPLFKQEDCEWHPRDRFICRSTLKRKQGGFSLSNGWIRRLEAWMKERGHHVLEVENPYSKHAPDMKLYKSSWVKMFLAENAEDYCKWLDRQQTYIELFERNREAIAQGRIRARQQQQQRRQEAVLQFEQEAREREKAAQQQTVAQSFSLDLLQDQIREQTLRCLQCASSIMTEQGFLCVIHQYELPSIPCPDWSSPTP
jgi:hypothetical protein